MRLASGSSLENAERLVVAEDAPPTYLRQSTADARGPTAVRCIEFMHNGPQHPWFCNYPLFCGILITAHCLRPLICVHIVPTIQQEIYEGRECVMRNA